MPKKLLCRSLSVLNSRQCLTLTEPDSETTYLPQDRKVSAVLEQRLYLFEAHQAPAPLVRDKLATQSALAVQRLDSGAVSGPI